MKVTRILGTLAMVIVTFWALSAGVDARAARFSDVSADAWYADAVYFVRDNGLMDGMSDTTFSPDNIMTSAQLVEVLYRMKGRPAADLSILTQELPDEIPARFEEQEAVAWAAGQGLLSGGSYAPAYTTGVKLILERY